MPAKQGVLHHKAKLTPEKVREARRRYAEGNISYLELCLDYDVEASVIRDAVIRKTWKHV